MQKQRADEDARRRYWRNQMEAAYGFMMEMMDYPVDECDERLVSLRDAAANASVEVLFSETKLAENYDRIFVLREGLIEKFIAIAGQMNNRGWILKLEDGFRTTDMQRALSRWENVFDVILERLIWEQNGKIPSADLMFRRLSALTAAFPRVGTHMSGSAMDVSVLCRDDGVALDRGGPYLELSELTPMDSPFVSEQAKDNRKQITALMAGNDFIAYPYEFWHYSSGDSYAEYLTGSGKPARYGPVDFYDNSVRPIENAKQPLHSAEQILAGVNNALKRMEKDNA